MKTVLISLIGFVLLCSCKDLDNASLPKKYDYQSYDLLLSKARILCDLGNDSAMELFEQAFEVYDKSAVGYLYLAKCSAKSLDYKSTYSALEETVKNGMDLESLKEHDELDSFFLDRLGKEFEQKYLDLRSYYITSLPNVDVYLTLRELLVKDQMVRVYDDDPEIKQFINDRMQKTDSENIEKLKIITVKYGFPTEQTVGYDAWIADMLLWHHRGKFLDENDQTWQYFKTTLKSMIDQGTLRKDIFARYIDFSTFYNEEQQVYGTKMGFSTDENGQRVKVILPIKDIGKVDIRRDSLGLIPLHYFAARNKAKVPMGYNFYEDE